MATLVTLRALTADERRELERLARSRTEEARLVVRARIVLGLAAGERPYQVADRVGVGRMAAYEWLHRFNAEGLKGLTDHPRPGRPHTYTAEQRAEVIATALTKPEALGLPFASWTLDRLQAYLSEHKGIGIKRTRIDEVLIAEGLRWRKQETWLGQKVDPQFAAKRGRSRNSTRPRPKGQRSSASTRWDRSRPRASRVKR
jgi:transposase